MKKGMKISWYSRVSNSMQICPTRNVIELTLKRYLLPDIRKLQQEITPSSTSEGDLLSALVVAIQQISTATVGKSGNPLKYDRRIIIVTDGRGAMDTSDLDSIKPKIKDAAAPIELVLLSVTLR